MPIKVTKEIPVKVTQTGQFGRPESHIINFRYELSMDKSHLYLSRPAQAGVEAISINVRDLQEVLDELS